MTSLLYRTSIAFALAALVVTPSVVAIADNCAGGQDAPGNVPAEGAQLNGTSCTGGLQAGADDADYYYVTQPIDTNGHERHVNICLSSALPANAPGIQAWLSYEPNLALGSAPNDYDGVRVAPGECATLVASSGSLNTLAGGRWYIGVTMYGWTTYAWYSIEVPI